MPNSLASEVIVSNGYSDDRIGSQRYELVYCLFCRTGQERSVVREINSWNGVLAVFPEKMKTELRNGRWEKVKKPLLIGYVFLYSYIPLYSSRVNRVDGVIRMLEYDDKGNELMGPDRAFADWILAQDGIVSVSKAVKDGDQVEIVDGPLKDMKGTIIAFDKRRRIAKIDLSLVGSALKIWLSFDYINAAGT